MKKFEGLSRNLMPLLAALLAVAGGLVGCVEESLQKLNRSPLEQQIQIQGNKTITVNANYCTMPAKRKLFKTKFVIVFDRSGSNQDCDAIDCPPSGIPGTDPDNSRRYDGMVRFLNGMTAEQQQTSTFALIDFNDPDDPFPGNYRIPVGQMDRGKSAAGHSFLSYTDFKNLLLNEKNAFNTKTTVPQDGGGTNYVRALSSVKAVLETEIYGSLGASPSPSPSGSPSPSPSASPSPSPSPTGSPAPLEKFAYAVIFVSDGAPVVIKNDGRLHRQSWRDELQPKMDDIMSLNLSPNVLGISLNTVFYSAAGIADSGNCNAADPNCAPCILGDPSCTPQDLLAKMAHVGGGDYLAPADGAPIDFSRITLPSIETSFNLVEFFVSNRNVVWNGARLVADGDGDGLSDADEARLGYNPALPSSRANGVSDWVDYRLCSQFCKLDGSCSQPCLTNSAVGTKISQQIASSCAGIARNADGTYPDTDRDGLNDCEERLLNTSPLNFDSNGDLLPDGLAALKGVVYKSADPICSSQDSDFDGLNDCLEVKLNTPPSLPNGAVQGLVPYKYTVLKTSENAVNSCYSIKVENVTVLSDTDKIQFFTVEQPNLFESSHTMRYADKPASSGTIQFEAGDFQ